MPHRIETDAMQHTMSHELIVAAQRGDKKAFEKLILKYRPTLYQFAMQATGDHDTAEDAVQETLIWVWQNLCAFTPNPDSPIDNFREWILSACKHNNRRVKEGRAPAIVVAYKMRRQNGTSLVSRPGDSLTPHPFDTNLILQEAIQTLPPMQQRVYLMCADGTPRKDISRALGISTASIRTNLHLARKKLNDYVKTADIHRDTAA